MSNHTPTPWTVIGSRTVVSDRWIHLRADDCRDERGHKIAPYYVLEPADWISVLAITTDGDVVIVEEYRHGAGVVALGTIGGAVEEGESALAAARRELREETGYAAGELIDLGATWANFGNHSNRVHHFLATGCVPTGERSLDDSETIAVHLMPLDAAGRQLEQSYHLLTWYLARDVLAGGGRA